jgi:hypothetical protein
MVEAQVYPSSVMAKLWILKAHCGNALKQKPGREGYSIWSSNCRGNLAPGSRNAKGKLG